MGDSSTCLYLRANSEAGKRAAGSIIEMGVRSVIPFIYIYTHTILKRQRVFRFISEWSDAT